MANNPKKFGAANDKPKVFSLRDLNDKHDNCSSDEDEKQTYYTGGKESGTAVQGAGRPSSRINDDAAQLMKKIFSQASSSSGHPQAESETSKFSGTGRKLNSEVIKKKGADGGSKASPAKPRVVTINLIFWSDGFTLNSGPLRRFDDPESVQFLHSIQSGSITAEELGAGPFELADVKISRLDIPFDANKLKNILNEGNPDSSSETLKAPTFNGAGEKLGNVCELETIIPDLTCTIDDSVQGTRIQVILPDGTKKVIKIEARASVSDLFAKIRAETGIAKFSLKSGTPVKLIPEDLQAFLYQLGLLNSSIIMSMK